jgi:hypothetical protein
MILHFTKEINVLMYIIEKKSIKHDHNKCGGLMVNVFISILKVKG